MKEKHISIQEHTILAPYVRKISSIGNYHPQKSPQTLRFFADGFPGFMFLESEAGMFLNGTKKLTNFFIYGQTVKPISISTFGKYNIIVVCLFPHVIKNLLGLNANDLTDGCMDVNVLPNIQDEAITEKLLKAESEDVRIKLINTFLADLISARNFEIDLEMRSAVSEIARGGGNEMIRNVQQGLKLSERTFIRKFENHVGVTPKLFSNICRFREALDKMERGNFEKLSDVAFESGYADQSHFIRSFKEFAGETPKEFLKSYAFS